ncbi:Uncharacterized protein APZ42_002540 [Daphnia magna]|uniref:Uncharacterized protein n=1 Tax=Daphnia magna TaxID=35525 RepID=A0A164I7D5_9CRUS|nr:Uncharacterized protein APZ42_002540 [Daphnia magna]
MFQKFLVGIIVGSVTISSSKRYAIFAELPPLPNTFTVWLRFIRVITNTIYFTHFLFSFHFKF